MTQIDRKTRLLRLAQHVNWYESAEAVIADAPKLICETMARGSDFDIAEARELFSRKQFIDAYRKAPPGLFTRKKWACWRLCLMGKEDALPFPKRFPEVEWEWPQSFQDNSPDQPAKADDIK